MCGGGEEAALNWLCSRKRGCTSAIPNITWKERRVFPGHLVVPARVGGYSLPRRCSLLIRKEEKKHRFPAFFLEENNTVGKMSVFPKISLRLEVEKYLKEDFMNKEVGQINLLEDICKNSDVYTQWKNRGKKAYSET